MCLCLGEAHGGHGLSTNRKVGFRAQQLGHTRSFLPPETGVGEARFQFCFSTEVCGAAVLWFLCGLSSQGRLGRKQPVRRTAAPFAEAEAEADVGSGRVPSSPSSTVRSTFIFPQQLPWRVWGAQTFISERPQPEVATHVRSQLQWGKGYLEASRGSPGFQTYCFLSLLCKNSLHLLISYLCPHGDSLFLLLVLGQRRPHCPGSSRNLSCGRNLPGHPFSAQDLHPCRAQNYGLGSTKWQVERLPLPVFISIKSHVSFL